jgi:hypothetical protein
MAALDLAARDALADPLAQHRLERAQLLGDAHLHVEEARIHRAQFERERAARRFGRGRGVARHALDHSL